MPEASLQSYCQKLLTLVLTIFVLMITGCGSDGPEFVPVSGTVTLNGKPISEAVVTFVPKQDGKPAMGFTDEQGLFSLSTSEVDNGAIVGSYYATVTSLDGNAVHVDAQGLSTGIRVRPRQKSILPRRYALFGTSGLSYEVQADMEPISIELTSK
jgi:hypothetical protein